VRTIKLFAVIGLAVALVGVLAAAQAQCPGGCQSRITLDVKTPQQPTLSVKFEFDNNAWLQTPLAQLPYQNIIGDGSTTPCLFNENNPVTNAQFRVEFGSTARAIKFKSATFFAGARCTGNPVGGGSVIPVSVPTLTEWGLIALAVLLAGGMGYMIYRRRPALRPAAP
jgi:hypothetical protein